MTRSWPGLTGPTWVACPRCCKSGGVKQKTPQKIPQPNHLQAVLAKLLELARAGVSEEHREKYLARIDRPDVAGPRRCKSRKREA